MAPGVDSDGELVARARAGDLRAFDRLVGRHRARVYGLARQITGQAGAAEDIAQEALVRAFCSLGTLREGASFGQWLNTIVRRESARWLRDGQRQPEPAEPGAILNMTTGLWAMPPALPDEVVHTISQAMGALSQRSRRAMVLHYLEGRTCQEIARALGVSEGRVKRLLYDSRGTVRREYEAMRDIDRKGPRQLSSWMTGDVPRGRWDAPAHLKPALAQAICLSVNKHAKTAQAMSAEIEAHLTYVEDVIADLAELEVLTSPRKGAYLLSFIALDAEDWRALVARMRQPAGELAHRLAAAQAGLREAYETTPLAGSGWSWEDVTWAINGLFVANRGLLAAAGEAAAPAPPVRPGGSAYWLGGYEYTAAVPLMDAPGCYGTERGDWAIGHFGPSMDHTGHTWVFAAPAYGRALLHALLGGPLGEDSLLARCATVDREQSRPALAELVAAGIVTREGARFGLAFPVFQGEDGEVLAPHLRSVTAPLLNEVLRPAWSGVGELLDDMGYRHLHDQYPVWRRWLWGFIAGEALRFLIKQGTLPALGDAPPAKWNYAAWVGRPPWAPTGGAE